jgi:methionyl-tRNA formyltransferase
MKIILLGHREIASNLGLSLLVASLREHELKIMLSGAGESCGSGTPEALVDLNAVEQQMCDALEQDSALARKAQAVDLVGYAGLAELTAHRVELLPVPNSEAGRQRIARFEPDLVISLRYRKILREETIAIPRLGVLNLHSGLLPRYRGVMATFYAMLEGASEIGSTLHFITDAGIDTGPVLQRSARSPAPGQTYLDNVLSLYPGGCRMVAEAVEVLQSGGTLVPSSQVGEGRYYSAPKLPDILQFQAQGKVLCDGDELLRFCGSGPLL